MSDIVERLRAEGAGLPAAYIKNAAADEIERLRVLVERTEKTLDLVETNARVQAKLLADTARERDELRAQVERQRSGLSEARADFLACAEVFDELDNPKGYNLAVGAAGQIERSFSSEKSRE